jgi:putative hemolysin
MAAMGIFFVLLLMVFLVEQSFYRTRSLHDNRQNGKVDFLLGTDAGTFRQCILLSRIALISCISALIIFTPGLRIFSAEWFFSVAALTTAGGLLHSISSAVGKRSSTYLFGFLAPVSILLFRLTSPVVKLINRLFQSREAVAEVQGVEFELGQALELNYTENAPSAEAHKLLQGIVKFGNTEVWQIMTPRLDIVSLSDSDSFAEVLETVRESGYSRMPVFKGDTIEGLLYIKDLLPYIDLDGMDWQKLIRPVYFVSQGKKIVDLLEEFQQKKIHLAVVINEYGTYEGLISLEDVVEEIVGDISDEFDDEEVIYSRLDDHNFIFEGKTSLPDFYKALGIEGEDFEEASKESSTIAGFILEQTGKIPRKHEKIVFGRYTFIVEAADRRKVKRVKVTIGA